MQNIQQSIIVHNLFAAVYVDGQHNQNVNIHGSKYYTYTETMFLKLHFILWRNINNESKYTPNSNRKTKISYH